MKRMIAFALVASAFAAFAEKTVFPYDTSLTTRIETNETVTVSDAKVTLTGEVTPTTDTVADLVMAGVTFTAIDAEDWAEFVTGLDGVAMLTVKLTDDVKAWYGYSDGVWVELTGPAPDLTTNYDVRISFDKTTGDKIRYSVAKHGDAYTDLTSDGKAWIGQGKAATQLAAVDLKGTGSAGSANLASGARAAYAAINGVDQTYSFDYSNVVFDVAVGDIAYGPNAKLRITLTDGGVQKSVTTENLVANSTNTVNFSDQNLQPGHAYDCKIEVIADDTPAGVFTNAANAVKLYTGIDWFGFNGEEFVNVGYTNNVLIVSGGFQADDEEQPIVVTPKEASGENTRSTVEVAVDYTYLAETNDFEGAQSALALTADGWFALVGGVWTEIENDNVPTAAGVYETRAEFDYTVNPGKVRFSVKNEDSWFVMKDGNENEWLALVGTSNRLYGTSFVGGGKVNGIVANYNAIGGIQPAVDPEKGEIVITGSTDMDLSKVTAGEYTVKSSTGKNYNMKWTDKDNKFAKVVNGKLKVIEGAPANGLGSYNSFALGLDPEEASSKPVLDSAQNASAANITFKVPNVVPNTDVADVQMKVITLDTPSATSGTETPFENGQAVIDLPAGVKYYKVKISIKTK